MLFESIFGIGEEMNEKIMKALGFDEELGLIEQGLCPFCQKEIIHGEFRDELSRKEYGISGLCQHCQDRMFRRN